MPPFLKLRSTTEPLRLEYNATHYVKHVVGSDGSYTIIPIGTGGAVMPTKFAQQDGIILQFPTGEAERNYNMTMYSRANPDGGASGRSDWVMRWGYNIAKGGGRANLSDHAIAIEFENYWYQAGSGYWTEFHAAYTSKKDGATRRLWSWLIDVDADTSTMYFQSSTYEFRGFAAVDAPAYLALNPTYVEAGLPIRRAVNNVDFLMGWTTADQTVSLLRLNDLDEVELGTTGIDVRALRALRVGRNDGTTPTARVEIMGGVDAAFNDLLSLACAGNSAGVEAGIRFKIATPDFGRLGYDGVALHWYTNTGVGSDTRRARLYDDLTLYTAGRGLVVTTPDGLHTYRLAVDNGGAITSTLVS